MHLTIKKRLLCSAIVASLGLSGFAIAPAFADQVDQDDQVNQAVEDEEEEVVLERVTVTGTRILREGIDTFYPAISVDAQLLEDGAFLNVADAINQIPSFGPGQTPEGPQGSFVTGQNFVDFLGLGTQRTLTLVNGRRFVSSNIPVIFGASGGLQVDFNVIPVALTDRVEIIGIGGAPIYGSDAIAGTINVILKERYEGFELGFQHGRTEENDNDFYKATMVAGTNFQDMRGNVYVSAEYLWQDPVPGTARPNIFDQSQFLADADGVRRIFRDRRIGIFTHGGLISDPRSAFGLNLVDPPGGLGLGPLGFLPDGNFYQFDENSNLVPFTPGAPDPTSVLFALGGDGPTFFDEVNQINSDVERGVFTTGMRYDLSDNVTFSSDFLYSITDSTELTNQGGFQTWAFGGTSSALLFSADHPFLPQQARDVLAANGVDQFFLHRFNNDVIDSSNNRKQNLWRIAAGLDGEFWVGDRAFNWEAYFVHGETDIKTDFEGIIDGRFLNAIDVRRLTEADFADNELSELDLLAFSGTETARPGDLICEAVFQAALGEITGVSGSGVTAANQPFVDGCIPLNIFGEGVADPRARDWVTGDVITQTDITQSIYNVNLTGELFELPGGPFGFAVGYERREEDAQFDPGLGVEIPLTRFAPFPPTGGGYKTDEFFGEAVAPLVSPDMDIPGVHLLELNAAYRHIDNSLAGSDDTWTVGGRWAPVPDITFRGNYTEAVRAPSVVELFTPLTQVFSTAADPCDSRFVNAGPVPDTRRRNCEADPNIPVSPDDFTSNIVNATAVGRSGGNPDLSNEKAEAWSVGFTFEPRFIDNLLLTADWFDVEIDDAITSLTVTQLMVACYDSENFPDVPACDNFTRDEQGQVVDFISGQTNAQSLETRRLEIGGHYRFFVDNVGQFATNSRISYGDTRKISVTGEIPDETIGGFIFPKWSGTQDFIFARDRHRVFWRILWQQSAKLSVTGDFEFERDDGERISRTRFRHLHNVSYSYRIPRFLDWGPDETIVQFNIDNLFDRQPDTTERAAGHFGFSEILGRRYTLSLRAIF